MPTEAEINASVQKLQTDATALQQRSVSIDASKQRLESEAAKLQQRSVEVEAQKRMAEQARADAEKAQKQAELVARMGGDARMFQPHARAAAEKYNVQQSVTASGIEEYNRQVAIYQGESETLRQQIDAYNADRERVSSAETEVRQQIDAYNAEQQQFNEYLQKVAVGGDAPQVVDVSFHTRSGRRDVFVRSATIDIPLEKSASTYGETGYSNLEQELESLKEWGIEGTKQYYGLGPEDVIRVDGKTIQESSLTPEQWTFARSIATGRQDALDRYKRERELEQDRLETEWLVSGRGTFAQPAAFIEAYKTQLSALPPADLTAIPKYNASQQQLVAKAAMLSSPEAQYAAPEFYAGEYAKMQERTVATIAPLGVERLQFKPAVSKDERGQIQFYGIEGAPGFQISGEAAAARIGSGAAAFMNGGILPHGTRNKKIPLFDPVTGAPNIRYDSPSVKPEVKYDPKYGMMLRDDLPSVVRREENLIRSVLPQSVALSSVSVKSMQLGRQTGTRIRGVGIDTSFLPQEIKESPGYKGGSYLFSLGRESTARLAEFAGVIPGTAELMGKTLIKEPKKFPGMLAVGGITFVGGAAKQAEKEPAQFISDLVVTTGLIKGMGKVKGTVTDTVKFSGKTFVPPESIIEPQMMPNTPGKYLSVKRGTTPEQLIKDFKTSKYRLPGMEGKIGGWHTTSIELPKKTKTLPGTSESPGMFIAPSAAPNYFRINRGQFKLVGFDNPPNAPSANWINVNAIERSPSNVRHSLKDYNAFLTNKAQKGTAYISSMFEQGKKIEKEAIIPEDTPLQRVSNEYYTKFHGKKVSLMGYTAQTQKPLRRTTPLMREFIQGKLPEGSTMRRPTSITMEKWKPVATAAAVVELQGKQGNEDTTTFGELSRKQARIESEYRAYKEPIFTPKSFLLSSYGEKPSTRSIISSFKRLMRSSTISDTRRSDIRSIVSSKSDARRHSITNSDIRSIVSSKFDILSPSKLDIPGLSRTTSRTSPPHNPPRAPPYKSPPYKPPRSPPYKVPPYKPPKIPVLSLSKALKNFGLSKKALRKALKWTIKNRMLSLKDL